MPIKQAIELRRQITIQILLGARSKNEMNKNPRPMSYPHVSVIIKVICNPNIAKTQINSIREIEK